MGLNQNTWKINQWYDQAVAGNVSYSGEQQLFMVGRDNQGQLGLNDQVAQISSPTQVPGTTWSEIHCPRNGQRSLALKTDGTLWSWGATEDGASGLNVGISYSSPTQIPGTTWAAVEIDTKVSLAQKTDGTLWTWGNNSDGGLGQNNKTNYSSPIQIGSGTDWSKNISAGDGKSGAVKTDGTLWVWGKNNLGNLGQNNRTDYSSPKQIPGTWSTSYGGLSMGSESLAIKSDGTLWAWGYGDSGSLGQNDTTWRSSPVQVGSDTTWAWINAEYISAFGVKTDGTLWSWGYGAGGSLGQNNQTARSSPIQIGSGTDWSKAWSNEMVGAGLKTDGTAWVWGRNYYGELGQNESRGASKSSPTQVPGNYKWISPNNFFYGFVKEL